MEVILEVIIELVIEGLFAGIFYIFNKFFKHKVSERTAKIIAGVLTALLIVGAVGILIVIIIKIWK
ncbi:hypothetical protein PV797_11940 [Clostridiaceae bacterium M8S5]|nr:hypothetical protein PV797_11940 [Clostridiaceae bacterium M8S5]